MVTYVWIGVDREFRVEQYAVTANEPSMMERFRQRLGDEPWRISTRPNFTLWGYAGQLSPLTEAPINSLGTVVFDRPLADPVYGPVIVVGRTGDDVVSLPDEVIQGIRNTAFRLGWVEQSTHHAAA